MSIANMQRQCDVPKHLLRNLSWLKKDEAVQSLREQGANGLFETFKWFFNGQFELHDVEPNFVDSGVSIWRREEAATAVQTAFKEVFGSRYDETACKEIVRHALCVRAYGESEGVSREDIEKGSKFLEVLETELQKLDA